jgi:hypothetical protein
LQQQQPTDKQTNVKASLLPRKLVRRRCEGLDRRDSEKLDNSCSFSLSLSLFASSGEIEESFSWSCCCNCFWNSSFAWRRIEELPIARLPEKRKEEEEEQEFASRGRDMNAALGSSVWPSSSSFSSSPSLLLSCFCICNGSLRTRHQASSSNNNDRSRFWNLSSSQSTSLLASRTRRHSHKKRFFSPYRQGLIQSCAGKTPPSPSPSPELAESEMSIAKERKQRGGGGLLEKKDDGAIVVERLFSNLNEATLEHEPGSLSSAVLLIAGTTVGAGILAIPSVTQESGFLASAVTCVTCWIYMCR